MIEEQSSSSSIDTVYWIYSSVPQVLAALVGLIVTGVLFYYPSLDKRVEANLEFKDIVDTVKKRLHRYVGFLLISTAVAIALDIVIMRYASQSASIMTSDTELIRCIPQSILFWVSLAINSIPILALIWVMMRIMAPGFEDITIERERQKIIIRQQKAIENEDRKESKDNRVEVDGTETVKDSESTNSSSPHNGHTVRITDKQFLEQYIRFEDLARKWTELQKLDRELPMRSIIDNLRHKNIISKDCFIHLIEATRIRNFILH